MIYVKEINLSICKEWERREELEKQLRIHNEKLGRLVSLHQDPKDSRIWVAVFQEVDGR